MTLTNSVFDEGYVAVVIYALWDNDLSSWGTTFWLVVTDIAPLIWKTARLFFFTHTKQTFSAFQTFLASYFLTATDPIKKKGAI